MARPKSQQLDYLDGTARAVGATPNAALQAAGVAVNAMIIADAWPTLTAALDTDVLSLSDYASVSGTANVATIVGKFNAVLARLDTDTVVTDNNFAATLSANATGSDLASKFLALLQKLDQDAGVPATTYRSGLATFTAFLKPTLDG